MALVMLERQPAPKIVLEYITAHSGLPKSIRPNTQIFNQGFDAYSIYFLESGSVYLEYTTMNGNTAILDVIRPERIFGTEAVIPGEEYKTTAIAAEKSAVVQISRPVLAELLRENPNMTIPFLQCIAAANIGLLDQVAVQKTGSASSKIGKALQDLSDKAGNVSSTQETIGETAGNITRVTVNKVLKAMENRGIVFTNGNAGIEIVNIHRLDEVIECGIDATEIYASPANKARVSN